MLITKTVLIEITSQNINYWTEKGYELKKHFSRNYKKEVVVLHQKIMVDVNDLRCGSTIKITYQCNICGKNFVTQYSVYCVTMNKDICTPCINKIRAKTNIQLNFHDWCVLHKKEDILTKWSPENEILPKEVSFSSHEKILFKCCKIPGHAPLLYPITYITNSKKSCKFSCPICNSLGTYLDDSALFSTSVISSKNVSFDVYTTSKGSKKVIWWVCENGIHDDYQRSIYSSVNYEFRCPHCAKLLKESRLQSKIRLFLESVPNSQLLHETQCTLKMMGDYNRPYRYNNELIVNNRHYIIEVNGQQHYHKKCLYNLLGARRNNLPLDVFFDECQNKDKKKQEFALSNGYAYIAIPYSDNDRDETWKKKLAIFLDINKE